MREYGCNSVQRISEKTQKTPTNEIEKAKKLMNEYFNEKNYGNKD